MSIGRALFDRADVIAGRICCVSACTDGARKHVHPPPGTRRSRNRVGRSRICAIDRGGWEHIRQSGDARRPSNLLTRAHEPRVTFPVSTDGRGERGRVCVECRDASTRKPVALTQSPLFAAVRPPRIYSYGGWGRVVSERRHRRNGSGADFPCIIVAAGECAISLQRYCSYTHIYIYKDIARVHC